MKPFAAPSTGFALTGAVIAASMLLMTRQARRCAHALRAGRGLPVHKFGRAPQSDEPVARVLFVGDSTGLGVGADHAEDSIAGLLARDYPEVEIANWAVRGASLAEVASHLPTPPTQPFDLVLLFAGANDILRHRRLDELVRDSEALLRRLHRYGDAIVWMGPPNIGLAPLFVPPLSWWFSRRARRACDAFKGVAGRERAHYVDFYRQARFDTFSAAPKHFFAADDIHPSTNAYRFCYHAAAIRQRVAACLFDRTSPVESCRQSLALQRSAASALPQQ